MASPRKRTRRPAVTPVAQSAKAAPAVQPQAVARVDKLDWAEEYSYVVRDIRKLFLISALLFAALLVIGYLL